MSRLSPGASFGVFDLQSRLGEGGMGTVFRARDTRLGRDVVIKVLLAEVADNPERLARFRHNHERSCRDRGPRVPLGGASRPLQDGEGATFDVSADGQRFVINRPVSESDPPLTVIVNWPRLLTQ